VEETLDGHLGRADEKEMKSDVMKKREICWRKKAEEERLEEREEKEKADLWCGKCLNVGKVMKEWDVKA
jgi:hypothetical protein